MSHNKADAIQLEESYDYVIIGTGPAGSVLANKLSKNGQNSVLILEAGANNDNDEAIKGTEGTFGKYSEYYWPELIKAQATLPGATFPLGGGRLAGGGSSVNSEIYIRPTPYVLNAWQQAGGDQWSLENATRHFRDLEYFNGENVQESNHGYEGRLFVRQIYQDPPQFIKDLGWALVEGTGHALIDDYNNPNTPMGPFYQVQLYQKPNGDRASSSVCFLTEEVTDEQGRGINGYKLSVLYEATATKIIFNQNKEARHVEYLHRGVCRRATARKKVILSAGIRSAKLLMLSGIGDEALLQDLGIDTVFDNKAVGQNLMNDATVLTLMHVGSSPQEQVASEHTTTQCGAFLPNPLEGKAQDHRGMQIITTLAGEMLMMILLYVEPQSRGTLTLQSADPLKAFLADEGFLSNSEDLEVLKAGLRHYIKPTADALSQKDQRYQLIELSQEVLQDDARLEQYIRQHFSQGFHEQGALRMGKLEEGAVVDGWGNVHGVKDLVVADNSIIPHHMDGNTSGCSYLIGATIAEHLLET